MATILMTEKRMSKKRVSLSKGEMVVASALWRLGSATLGELFEEVVDANESMEYATVQSYIRRLEDKGYVKSKKAGRNKVYQSAVKPEKVIGQTVDEMLRQLVSGESMPVFRHLIQERGVTKDEIDELRKMINEAEATDKEEE